MRVPVDRIWVRRFVVVALWATILLLWTQRHQASGSGTLDTAQRFVDEIEMHWWGPVAYVAAYLLRPLLLFPASVMTVAAGLVFGPVVGVLLVVVAANASAMVAYAVGRSIAGGVDGASTGDDARADLERAGASRADEHGRVDDERAGLVARWGRRLRERSFETVFVMRLLFLPYDLVNYVCGALRIRWTPFLAATALGTLPGTISFVLLGASLERLDEGLGGIDPWTVLASLAIFAVSLLAARITRTRTGRTTRSSEVSAATIAPLAATPSASTSSSLPTPAGAATPAIRRRAPAPSSPDSATDAPNRTGGPHG